MKRLYRTAFFLIAAAGALLCIPAWGDRVPGADETVAIIRHGEKPKDGLGQLSPAGLKRALALPEVLIRDFGSPTALFAPNPTVDTLDGNTYYPYIRPLATIEPLAIRVGEPVNIQWGMENYALLAQYLLAQKHGTYIVAWEHHDGEALAKLLLKTVNKNDDWKKVPTWRADDFDSIYIVSITNGPKGERHATFHHKCEHLSHPDCKHLPDGH
jgi:hypothetical protein